MNKAIEVKFLGATATKGARYKAFSDCKESVVVEIKEFDPFMKVKYAALKLAEKMKWHGQWHGGRLPNGNYCFVCVGGNADFKLAENIGVMNFLNE